MRKRIVFSIIFAILQINYSKIYKMAKKRTEKKTKTFSEAIGLQYIFNNTITDFS